MRNYLYAGLVGLSMTAPTVAQADANAAVVGGRIVPNCSVTDVKTDIGFGADLNIGSAVDSPVTIFCNDSDGATVSLTSSEGGLESDDDEDFEVEYTARLNVGELGLDLSLDTTGQGNNDVTVDTVLPGSIPLAQGKSGTILITLLTDAVYAGGYQDTLSINIVAE